MHLSTHSYHLYVLNGMTSLLMSHSLLHCLRLNIHFLGTYKSYVHGVLYISIELHPLLLKTLVTSSSYSYCYPTGQDSIGVRI